MAKKISIIIPAYNEEDNLIHNIDRIHYWLNKLKFDYQIIVSDDGSTDKTSEIALKCNATLIRSEKNKGKGHALREGLKYAIYNNVLMLDADLSVNIKELFKYNYFWLINYPIIKGQRIQIRKQPPIRILLGKIWKLMVYFKIDIYKDTQCPFLMLNGNKAINHFKTGVIDGFAFDIEFLRTAIERQIRIKWIYVEYYNQKESRVTVFKIMRMLIDLLKLKKKEKEKR